MQNLVISVENPLDTQLLLNLVARLGMKVRTLSAMEEHLLARQALVKMSEKTQDDYVVDMDEILSVVEEVRGERYKND